MSINRGRKRRDDSPAEQEEPSTDARPNTRPPVTHSDPSGHEDQWQMVLELAKGNRQDAGWALSRGPWWTRGRLSCQTKLKPNL